MPFGRQLDEHRDALIRRWYDAWQALEHPYPEMDRAALVDHLPCQIQVIAQRLQEVSSSESPRDLWQVKERLDPEARVAQEVPIEEVVQEYGLFVKTVQQWIEEEHVDVTFREYAYFYESIFELVAESVRRYTVFQAEQVTKERAEYLAGLAHQMRNPLSALSLEVQRLQRTKGALGEESVNKLRRLVNRLSFLVDGVMRLERFKPEELPVHPQDIFPARVIDQMLDDRALEAARKQLRLETVVNRALSMRLDPDLFIDVLGNLIDNAVKYTDSGFVRVKVDEEPDHVVFRVQDSGPGIPAELRDKLFQPVRPGKKSGAGIGLHIARRAVEAQGGTIDVDSTPGQGTTLRFRLPRVVHDRSARSSPLPDGHSSQALEGERSADGNVVDRA